MMHATWIVLADSSRARIFATDPELEQGPEVVEELVHPAGRLREQDLVSDRPSRSMAEGHGAFPATDIDQSAALDHERDLFAAELAQALDAGRKEGRYEGMVLVAPPRFLGVLRKRLDQHTLALVQTTIDKELTALPQHQVLAEVRRRLA